MRKPGGMLGWALAIWTLTGGELRWQAPEQCPSAEAVRAQIDDAGGLGDLEVDAVITTGPSEGWTLALRIGLAGVSQSVREVSANIGRTIWRKSVVWQDGDAVVERTCACSGDPCRLIEKTCKIAGP